MTSPARNGAAPICVCVTAYSHDRAVVPDEALAAKREKLLEAGRKSYAKNREKVREAHRQYYAANQEKTRARYLRNRAAHPEKFREKGRKSNLKQYSKDPNKACARVLKWHADNPAKSCILTQRRRARLQAAQGSGVTAGQWQALLTEAKGHCFYCEQASDKLTMDHIVPLSRGGAHDTANVVPACRSCNASKGRHDVLDWFSWKFVEVAA